MRSQDYKSNSHGLEDIGRALDDIPETTDYQNGLRSQSYSGRESTGFLSTR